MRRDWSFANLYSPLCRKPFAGELPMTEERKHALLLAATILAARKLAALESDRPSPGEARRGGDGDRPCEVHTGQDRREVAGRKIVPGTRFPLIGDHRGFTFCTWRNRESQRMKNDRASKKYNLRRLKSVRIFKRHSWSW